MSVLKSEASEQPHGMSRRKKWAIGAAIAGAAVGVGILIKKYGLPDIGGGGGIAPPTTELLLFGGQGHKVFLGCLSCGSSDSGSVHNKYGAHGNRYGSDSIFNRFGDYGSRYSDHSACNPYATDPPIIVDRSGNAYGRLTLNRFGYQVKAPETVAWLEGVCSGT